MGMGGVGWMGGGGSRTRHRAYLEICGSGNSLVAVAGNGRGRGGMEDAGDFERADWRRKLVAESSDSTSDSTVDLTTGDLSRPSLSRFFPGGGK